LVASAAFDSLPLPLLAEYRDSRLELYSNLSEITGIKLFQNNSVIHFETTAVIAFDREARRFAVSLPAMSFEENLGIYLENSLTHYYSILLDVIVPYFKLASDFFLYGMLSGPTQTLTSGILGPNRLSERKLNDAFVSVARQLQLFSEILDANGLSADRPVIVGHGANGLLLKALNFTDGSDPWRIAFESPMLTESPMAALANLRLINATRSRILNFYSEGSMYALYDDAALTNHRIPKYSPWNPLIPPDASHTFCFAVAACGNDTRLDGMCEHILDGGKFEKLAQELGRPRLRTSA
jgi:hypothetical protein